MEAVKKIKSELKNAKLSQKGKAVKLAVADALILFCNQNSEFAQAVEQSDKTVADCIESTVKGAGQSISDLEVYKKAATFYFPGADVKFHMTIDLGDGGFSNNGDNDTTPKKPEQMHISLDDLLDF